MPEPGYDSSFIRTIKLADIMRSWQISGLRYEGTTQLYASKLVERQLRVFSFRNSQSSFKWTQAPTSCIHRIGVLNGRRPIADNIGRCLISMIGNYRKILDCLFLEVSEGLSHYQISRRLRRKSRGDDWEAAPVNCALIESNRFKIQVFMQTYVLSGLHFAL